METVTSPALVRHKSPHFPSHDLSSAPAESRPFLEATLRAFGFIPLPTARHASAPGVVDGFSHLLETFEKTTLSPLEREAVALVLAGKFDCNVCRALHTRLALSQGASQDLVRSLIARKAIALPRLAALAEFTEALVETRGAVSDEDLERFLDSGFTPRQALEIVLGISTYTLSIFANRLTRSESLRE
jgi:AhpD family alkylhydroperoxidase